MAALTVTRGDWFPPGTTVGAYKLPVPLPGEYRPTGEPTFTKVAEAVVASSGTLELTGLVARQPYILWAEVGGVDRYLYARVSTASTAVNSPHAWVSLEPEAGTLPGIEVFPAPGEAAATARVGYRIASGTSVTFKLQKNGVDLAGATGLVAKTEAAAVSPTVTLAEGDYITCVITAVSGAPKGFSATLQLDHTQAT